LRRETFKSVHIQKKFHAVAGKIAPLGDLFFETKFTTFILSYIRQNIPQIRVQILNRTHKHVVQLVDSIFHRRKLVRVEQYFQPKNMVLSRLRIRGWTGLTIFFFLFERKVKI
jgi:hypothetical protein